MGRERLDDRGSALPPHPRLRVPLGPWWGTDDFLGLSGARGRVSTPQWSSPIALIQKGDWCGSERICTRSTRTAGALTVTTRHFLTNASAPPRDEFGRAIDRGQLNGDPLAALGLVLAAKRAGRIASARLVLEHLRDVGMYLSDTVLDRVLRQVGELPPLAARTLHSASGNSLERTTRTPHAPHPKRIQGIRRIARLLASERIGIRLFGARLDDCISGSNLDRLLARVESVANPAERNLTIFLCEL